MGQCPTCGEANPDRAKFCSECATLLGVRGERAERKVVTALFCDLVGSTALGEAHDPEALEPLLARYFDDARAAVERHGGRVEKFIGDAVAAVFGVPTAHEDDALRAARAALDIQDRMRRLRDGSVTPISCRIGINTGEVLASGDYAPLVGDAMNVAARLQAAAEPDGVLLGESTYLLVRDAVRAEMVEPVAAKGKAQPVRAYRLLEVLAGAEGIARHLDSPLVGRMRERALLDDALARAVEDESVQLVTLVGQAGIGKTRLVEEFMAGAGSRATVVRGRCLAYGEGITFWPIAEIVRDAAGVLEGDPVDIAREKVAVLLPDGPDRATIVERVTELLGLGAVPNPDETFWAIRKLLEALAAERPLVCVIEDLHWAEPRLLDLVDHVADWSRGSPILLLCDARPEFLEKRPGWAGGKLNAAISLLRPLSSDEVRELIANLARRSDLEAAVVARVVEAAEGNPLFVEQLLAMLADQGVLRLEDGRWTTTGEVSLVLVPPTIQALLGARLAGLSAAERRLLEAGSVEGRTFHLGTAAELSGIPRGDAEALLVGMVRKELLRPDRATLEGESAFRFRHILITDAAYGTISKRSRADLHERFADLLEARLGERVPEVQEILGHHLERAVRIGQELGLPDDRDLAGRAAAHLGAAGHRALARGDAAATAVLLERAVALLPIGADRLGWVPDLAWALQEIGRADDALRLLADAVASTSEAESGLLWHRVRVEHVLAEFEFGEPPEQSQGVSIAQAGIAAAEAAGNDVVLARALTVVGRLFERRPFDLVAAKDAFERACVAGIRSGDVRVIANAEDYLGGVYSWGPFDIEEAVAFCERSYGLNVARDRLLWGSAQANVYARRHAFRGEFGEARAALDRAAESFDELGSAMGWGDVAVVRAEVALLARDRGALGAVLREASERAEATQDRAPGDNLRIAGDLAFYWAELGDVDAADLWLTRAVAGGLEVADLGNKGSGARLRALLLRGRPEEALDDARHTVALGRTLGRHQWLVDWAALLGCVADVFETAGSQEELRSTLDELADAYRRKGNLVALERTERRIADLA
jgi:class 3 adenylate cyclase/tetratricopeptide (TPR) repeat protein